MQMKGKRRGDLDGKRKNTFLLVILIIKKKRLEWMSPYNKTFTYFYDWYSTSGTFVTIRGMNSFCSEISKGLIVT